MKDIRTLHKTAIDLIKKANTALQEGNVDMFNSFSMEAYNLENQAAMDLITDFEAEPTRSVLFRSAATLAFNLGKFTESEKLIYLALSGNVYAELKAELHQLLEKTQFAISNQSTAQIGIENAYLDNLKEKAAFVKIEPKERYKYSKGIVVDYIVDFLKNIQSSFSSFSEVNFKKNFTDHDFKDFNKVLGLFKKESKTICVDLKFASFGVSIVADTSIMNYRDIASSDKFLAFKSSLFDDFKREILMSDLNSPTFQNEISQKYSPDERVKIFSPIIDSLKEKSNYTVSIVDRDFKSIIKHCSTVSKQTQSILKPEIEEINDENEEILLKRTFELTNSEGQKKEKLLSENLDYAEFKLKIENITSNNKHAYFINPYEIKVIFNHGVFIIDDEYYKIYVENADANYKDLQTQFSKELIDKFSTLLETKAEDLNVTDKTLLDLYKSTLIKGW